MIWKFPSILIIHLKRFDNNSNKINKSSRANILGNIEHEIEHLFSDAGARGNTFKKSHPTLKVSDDIGMGNFKASYYSLPYEQQVRFRKSIKKY